MQHTLPLHRAALWGSARPTQAADLQVELLGTTDHMTISGWYADNARVQVQGFDTADGMKLDSQVAQLVSAMAAYSSANPAFDATTATQMPDDRALQTTVAAAWHS